jgi:hypothetical protein
VFGEGGDEVVSINAKTSAAVTYPSDTLGRILIFDVNICQLPVNHTFYILLDAGELWRGNCVNAHSYQSPK